MSFLSGYAGNQQLENLSETESEIGIYSRSLTQRLFICVFIVWVHSQSYASRVCLVYDQQPSNRSCRNVFMLFRKIVLVL